MPAFSLILVVLCFFGAGLALPQQSRPNIDILYEPSPTEVVDEMLKLAKVQKDDVVYDLGCGDGRIVIAAAKSMAQKVSV